MKLLTTVLALATAAIAAPSRTTHFLPNQNCCFNLADASSSSPVQQAPEGWLYLGHDSHPTKSYCIDERSQLRDPNNSACFIDPKGQVKCHDVSPSGDEWALEGSGADRRLVVNGGTGFLACEGRGGEAIWNFGKTGCREIEIQPVKLEGGC